MKKKQDLLKFCVTFEGGLEGSNEKMRRQQRDPTMNQDSKSG